MKRRLTVILCVILLLSCVLPNLAVQATDAQSDTFQVGFARVDINPYIDPTLTGDALVAKENIMALPLRGSGDVWNRLSTYGLIDDDGDGRITSNDGLKVTCIAVSDQAGKTVLLITIDLIGGSMISEVRTAVCERLAAEQQAGELTDVILTSNSIFYGGTHTHEAPDVTVYSEKGKVGTNDDGVDLSVINENLGIWIERTVDNIATSAILALKDRAAAKLIKDQISASQAKSSVVKGKVMNSVRHYVNEAGGCVAGDNFNNRGSDPKQITQVNDTMYLLQFDFSEYNKTATEDKLNIVLANWRAHPSMNASNDYKGGSRNCFSSDYINSFRHALEYCAAVRSDGTAKYDSKRTYRVAFFSGAGGNVNPRGREVKGGQIVGKWIDDMATNNGEGRGNGYGRVLYAMAYEGMMDSKNRQEVEGGEVITTQYVYNSTRNATGVDGLAYEAAKSFQAAYEQNKSTKTPYIYKTADGQIYVVGSRFHANSIVSRWDYALQEAKSDLVDMELNVFMLGKQVAFVTAPGEPFDYYYNEDGSNAWNNLVNNDLYGTPFVLGYCNGAKGYIPNSKAYDYNLGSTNWVRGSYETNISPYQQGTGEHMIQLFGKMLNMLSSGEDGSVSKLCTHCGEVKQWLPYNGSLLLTTGHYFLDTDVDCRQIHIEAGQTVCFDMNGYTMRGENRAFYTASGAKATLNLMDLSPEQTGVVMGSGSNNGIINGFNGATMIIDSSNTCNFYSGTLSAYRTSIRSVHMGGVIRNKGTFNMYGGVITGGVGYSFTGSYIKSKVPTSYSREGCAATIHSTGTFNIYGGRIDAGEFRLITGTVEGNEVDGYIYKQTVTPCEGDGYGLYSTGKVNIYGDAQIADIYFEGSSAKLLNINTSEGPYTGKFQLTYGKALPDDLVLGTCTSGTELASDTVTFTNGALTAQVNGTQLMATTGAAILNTEGGFHYYASAKDAYSSYTSSSGGLSYIKLHADVTEKLKVGKKVYLDLNGFDLAGGVSVSSGKTLYCLDSQTKDFDVTDGVYGVIAGEVSGNIQPIPKATIGTSQGDYLMVTDENGLSFHMVKATVTKLSMRPSEVGMYYTASFAGDTVVAGKVLEYGIALNAYEEPNAENIAPGGTSICVAYTDTWTQDIQVVGAMLSGIMKPENEVMLNISNAGQKVYGRAYIKTENGYIFSNTAAYSLHELVELADEYNGIQGEAIAEMAKLYALYQPVLDMWNLPRLRLQMAELAG